MKLPALACATLALAALPATVAADEGRAWGDIHIRTMDGAIYDFQETGEFVASRSTDGDFEVQIRLESTGFGGNVSIATGVAALVDTTRASVILDRSPMLHIDGKPAALPGGSLELPGGGWIERTTRGFELGWSDGSTLTLEVRKRFVDAFLRPAPSRRGTLSGLFGDFDGSAGDDTDLVTTAKSVGALAGVDPMIEKVAKTIFVGTDDERYVAPERSLFQYRPGQTTSSFRRSRPAGEANAAELPTAWRRRAETACREAGVTDPELFRACVIDVGYTRDESFAESALAVQARDSELSQRSTGGR